jgi:hypothetical protein
LDHDPEPERETTGRFLKERIANILALCGGKLSLFQNPVGFETSSWKNRPKVRFFH